MATAGANFFRSIGGSFGTAVFGAIFANELPRQLAANLRGLPVPHLSASSFTPAALHKLPPAVLSGVLNAITQTIQHIYRVAAPIGLVAVALSFTLPEIRLRTTAPPDRRRSSAVKRRPACLITSRQASNSASLP